MVVLHGRHLIFHGMYTGNNTNSNVIGHVIETNGSWMDICIQNSKSEVNSDLINIIRYSYVESLIEESKTSI